MRVKFDEQLQRLNDEMILMDNMIQNAIQDAMQAFFSQDTEKAKQIMKDDILVDQEQKKIENICFQLMIQQQPVARDMRNITAAMKMVTDMERIGDHAADISELTILMADCPYLMNEVHFRTMAEQAIQMLTDAIAAYVEKDMEKAKEVIVHDDLVDKMFLKIKKDMIGVMQENSDYADHAADLLLVNKYLERIGDHASNVAEWVIFSLDDHLSR